MEALELLHDLKAWHVETGMAVLLVVIFVLVKLLLDVLKENRTQTQMILGVQTVTNTQNQTVATVLQRIGENDKAVGALTTEVRGYVNDLNGLGAKVTRIDQSVRTLQEENKLIWTELDEREETPPNGTKVPA